MENASLLIIAMSQQCRSLIQGSTGGFCEPSLSPPPTHLGTRHLLSMCDQIDRFAEEWPVTKLHRWIGFIQAGMLVNQILDIQDLRGMFQEAKNAYGNEDEDLDLLDHLDPNCDFRIDIGGEA